MIFALIDPATSTPGREDFAYDVTHLDLIGDGIVIAIEGDTTAAEEDFSFIEIMDNSYTPLKRLYAGISDQAKAKINGLKAFQEDRL